MSLCTVHWERPSWRRTVVVQNSLKFCHPQTLTVRNIDICYFFLFRECIIANKDVQRLYRAQNPYEKTLSIKKLVKNNFMCFQKNFVKQWYGLPISHVLKFCIATFSLNKKTFYIIKNEIETDIKCTKVIKNTLSKPISFLNFVLCYYW